LGRYRPPLDPQFLGQGHCESALSYAAAAHEEDVREWAVLASRQFNQRLQALDSVALADDLVK
jgi:hypothetical protein